MEKISFLNLKFLKTLPGLHRNIGKKILAYFARKNYIVYMQIIHKIDDFLFTIFPQLTRGVTMN